MAKKGKVLVVTFSFPTSLNTSAGIFVLNQLEFLKKDYDIKVIAPFPYVPPLKFLRSYRYSKIPHVERLCGLEVHRPRYFMFPRNWLSSGLVSLILPIEAFFSYLSSKKIIKELAGKWDFDMIHSHGFVPDSVIASKAKKRYNKPLIVTLHGEDVTKYSGMPILKGMSRKVLNDSDRIICVSKSLRDEIYRKGLTKKPIEIIPSGYNAKRFRPISRDKCRKSLGLPQKKKIILFVGHLVERKGPVYLISALKALNERQVDFLCCIVGSGKLGKKLKAMASDFGIADKVVFAGHRDPDEIPLWMNASDLIVLPSLNEGLPNVLSEALACGKPVVAANVAGNPEIISNEVGLLVNAKDSEQLAEKISIALDKRWEQKKLLKRAEGFSVVNSAKKIDNIYSSLLKSVLSEK